MTASRIDDDQAGAGPLRPRSDRPGSGPHDEDDLDPDRPDGVVRTDFKSLLVPVPDGGMVNVEPSTKGKLQAVHVMVPEGRLSVSALAAPTTGRLWPELAKEINTSLRDGGARVRSVQGRWGRELRARTGEAFSVFVGIDGPRWMVYGVATGPIKDARALDRALRRMLGETVVVRGRSPFPVRTVLPLVLPEDLQAEQDEREARAAAAAAAVEAEARATAEPAVAPAVTEAAPAAPAVPDAEPDDPPTEEFPVVAPAPAAPRESGDPGARVGGSGRASRGTGQYGPGTNGRRPAAPVAAQVDSPTEIIPVVRPPAAVDPGSGRDTAAPGEATGPVAVVSTAVRAPRNVTAEPALAFLMGNPMDLFRAAPPGRHRRGD